MCYKQGVPKMLLATIWLFQYQILQKTINDRIQLVIN